MLLDFAYTLTFFIIALPMVVFFGAQPDDRLVWVVAFFVYGLLAQYPFGATWGFSSKKEARAAFKHLIHSAFLVYFATFGLLFIDYVFNLRDLLM
jgi:hypothetical protein